MFSKVFFIFLIVNFVLDAYGQKAKKFFRKDYNYIEAFESFYKVHSLPRNWTDAKQICALEGATFWHPDNDKEAQALISSLAKTRPNIDKIYLGLSDMLVEGVFVTDEVYEVFNTWEPNQPDNYNGRQDCVCLNLRGKKMDDDFCDLKYPFLCKKRLQSLEWNYQCDMSDLDYAYNKESGKCYKFHTTPLDWSVAYATCLVEQSSLAVINNRQEANFLSNLTESTPKPRIKGHYQRGIYHLGFHNRFNQGWQTVKGTQMKADENIWYDNYQPEGDCDQECGSMFYTGSLINSDCNMRSFFICEHELDK